MDALASRADEGRGTLRKASVSRVQALTAVDIRMGKPTRGHARVPPDEHIVWTGGTEGTETS